MDKVFLEMTISLDGFVAAPNIAINQPLGEDGEPLHNWLFKGAESNDMDRQVSQEFFSNTGAFIIGRRTFDLGIDAWGDDGAFGKPCFVITHRPTPPLVKGPTVFTFVTDGIVSALSQAKAAADEQDICIMGGAAVAQQYLKAGLIDKLRIHIAPLLLGAGTRLFDNITTQPVELKTTRVLSSPFATHLRFDVVK
jgi:dihydrofolate reductase